MNTIQKVTNSEATKCIQMQAPFTNSSGSLTGEYVAAADGPRTMGELPHTFRSAPSLLNASYVVYSYVTPIAWVCRGRWYYPDVNYSPTTSQHQHGARRGMTGKPRSLSADYRAPGLKRSYNGSSARVPAGTGTPERYFN